MCDLARIRCVTPWWGWQNVETCINVHYTRKLRCDMHFYNTNCAFVGYNKKINKKVLFQAFRGVTRLNTSCFPLCCGSFMPKNLRHRITEKSVTVVNQNVVWCKNTGNVILLKEPIAFLTSFVGTFCTRLILLTHQYSQTHTAHRSRLFWGDVNINISEVIICWVWSNMLINIHLHRKEPLLNNLHV